jgi:hypothetical protein
MKLEVAAPTLRGAVNSSLCCVMTASAGAFVREFRPADLANEDHPTLRRGAAARGRCTTISSRSASLAEDVDRTPFKATMGKNLRRGAA